MREKFYSWLTNARWYGVSIYFALVFWLLTAVAIVVSYVLAPQAVLVNCLGLSQLHVLAKAFLEFVIRFTAFALVSLSSYFYISLEGRHGKAGI